jgi:excisionase family DNA binding protein
MSEGKLVMEQKREPLMGYSEAAAFLGVPKGTLYWWVHEGRVPFVRLGRLTVRFDPADLRTWIDTRRHSPDPDDLA